MAKAPRGRGERGSRRPDREDKGDPKPVAPIVPPKATGAGRPPSVPPAVAPVAPPVVPPVAPPIAPPMAAPVAARPVAAPVAAPVTPQRPSGRARKDAAEEEVARGGRRSRGSASGHGGMGLPAKAGLIAALVTLIAVAGTVYLAGGSSGEPDDTELNHFGLAAAGALVSPGLEQWKGTEGEGKNRYDTARLVMSRVWRKSFDEWLEGMHKFMNEKQVSDWKEKERLELQEHVDKQLERYEKGGDNTNSNLPIHLRNILARLSLKASRYQALAAWLRLDTTRGVEGDWVAGTVSQPETSALDFANYVDLGNGFGYSEGTVRREGRAHAVRIFAAAIKPLGTADKDAVRGYVAVYDTGPAGGGQNASLGMLMLILGPLFVGFAVFSVANRHVAGIRGLAREIDRLGSSGDPGRGLRAQGAEASAVARSIERMVGNLEFRAKHEGADLEQIVSKEAKIAEEIHGALIAKNPPRLLDYEVETLFKPGFEIGGDHFEYFMIDQDHLGLILLDTNVRGVHAALVMASAKAYVRAAAPGELSPANVLRTVNRHLAPDLPAGRYVTALYVVLNQREGKATAASAGHLPLLVYRHAGGRLAKVNPEGIALGLDPGPVFDRSLEEGDLPIGVGDRIVLYTDGVLRIQNQEGEEFGESRFYQAVSADAPKNSQAFVNFVGGGIDRFHIGATQNDDITISTIKRLR